MTADPPPVLSLPIAEIDPTALIRDRTRLNEEALAELMISIAGTGLRQPIEVWAFPEPFEGLHYGLISGARRLTACQRLGHTHVPAFLRTPKSIPEAMADMIAENDVREDLSPWERGRILNRAVQSEMFGTLDEALKALHRGASSQKQSRLRGFAKVVQEFDGKLISPEDLTVRQMERIALALKLDFAPLIYAAFGELRPKTMAEQWEVLLPILREAEQYFREPEPVTTLGRPRRFIQPRPDLRVRRELTPQGWRLNFSGPEATGMLMESLMDEIERLVGK